MSEKKCLTPFAGNRPFGCFAQMGSDTYFSHDVSTDVRWNRTYDYDFFFFSAGFFSGFGLDSDFGFASDLPSEAGDSLFDSAAAAFL